MNTKKILLAAAAVGAMAFSGAASAHTLTYRAVTVSTADIDAADANATTGPNGVAADSDINKYGQSLVGSYLLAQEVSLASISSGTATVRDTTLALADVLSSGTLPSGNNVYTLTLTNATFGEALSSANFVGANCTSVVSSGGTATSNTVTLLVSSNGGSCAGFTAIDLPIKLTTVGSVGITANYTTEQGLAVETGPSTLLAIAAVDAIQPTFNGTIGGAGTAGAELDTTALIAGTPIYSTLGGDNIIGKLAIYYDQRASRTLASTGADVVAADVTDATVTLVGDFSAFDGAATLADNPELVRSGSAAGTGIRGAITATTATFASAQANVVQPLSAKPAGSRFLFTADGASIPNSAYTAGIAYSLAAGYSTQTTTTGAMESIDREGTNFVAPWFSGSSAQSQSQIRLSSTGAAAGPVRVTLVNGIFNLNGTPTTFADSTCATTFTVPADGDLVLSSAVMQSCFGNFTRGDVLITVEGAAGSLTAKMRNTSATGTFETTLGRYSGATIAGAAQ